MSPTTATQKGVGGDIAAAKNSVGTPRVAAHGLDVVFNHLGIRHGVSSVLPHQLRQLGLRWCFKGKAAGGSQILRFTASLAAWSNTALDYFGAPPAICDLDSGVADDNRWRSDPGMQQRLGELSYCGGSYRSVLDLGLLNEKVSNGNGRHRFKSSDPIQTFNEFGNSGPSMPLLFKCNPHFTFLTPAI